MSPRHSRNITLLFFVVISILCTTAQSAAADSRFVTLKDGTVKDNDSGLIWAPRDNGAAINWSQAKSYCREYTFGGHSDWRMPSSEELGTLYGNTPKVKGKDYQQSIDVLTTAITITAPWVWTARRGPKNKAFAFGFNYGTTRRLHRGSGGNRRALPVRQEP